METSIPEIYNGVNNAMTTIANYSSYMETLYALVAIVSFIWIIIDFKGTVALVGNLRNHFFTLFFIWVFFGSGAITSDVTVTLDNPDGSTTALTYTMAPGFKYITAVINSVTGWAKSAIGTVSMNANNIDVGKMPFATERYTMKLAQVQQMISQAAKDPTFADKNKFYYENCLNLQYLQANRPATSYDIYGPSYIRTNPPPNSQCLTYATDLTNLETTAITNIAKQRGLNPADVAGADPRTWAQRTWDSTAGKLSPSSIAIAVAEAIASVFLRYYSLIPYAIAYIYTRALPFFIGILNQMYVTMYPIVVAMAMLPGRWKEIVKYFEGYLWLAFIPVVVAAVDFSGMGLTGIATDLLSLPATMLMLAKIAIVLSAPAITSFLLFGQRSSRIGSSNVASSAAYGAAAAVRGAVRSVIGPSGKGRPGGGGGGSRGPAGNILDGGGGWGGGNVVASTGGRGQPPSGTPVTTAASNYEMHKGNSEAFDKALAAVTGDNSASPPDHVATQMVSGNISRGRNGGELGGALKNISPEMLRSGVGVQVQDSASGSWNSVHMQTGADGRVSFSKPEGGTAADGAMAERLNRAGKGEIFAARTVVDGYKFSYLPGGGANLAKLRWGNMMSSENMYGGDLYDFLSREQKKYI
jgi:hypothetical protein